MRPGCRSTTSCAPLLALVEDDRRVVAGLLRRSLPSRRTSQVPRWMSATSGSVSDAGTKSCGLAAACGARLRGRRNQNILGGHQHDP